MCVVFVDVFFFLVCPTLKQRNMESFFETQQKVGPKILAIGKC